MVFDLVPTLTSINSLITAFRDIAILIIIILGFRYLGKEINQGIKKMPEWIERYFDLRNQQMLKVWAKGDVRR